MASLSYSVIQLHANPGVAVKVFDRPGEQLQPTWSFKTSSNQLKSLKSKTEVFPRKKFCLKPAAAAPAEFPATLEFASLHDWQAVP